MESNDGGREFRRLSREYAAAEEELRTSSDPEVQDQMRKNIARIDQRDKEIIEEIIKKP